MRITLWYAYLLLLESQALSSRISGTSEHFGCQQFSRWFVLFHADSPEFLCCDRSRSFHKHLSVPEACHAKCGEGTFDCIRECSTWVVDLYSFSYRREIVVKSGATELDNSLEYAGR
jgi:hypothetical protein